LLASNSGPHPIEFDSLVREKFLCKAFDVVARRKGNKRCKQVKIEKEWTCIRLFVIVPLILLYVIFVLPTIYVLLLVLSDGDLNFMLYCYSPVLCWIRQPEYKCIAWWISLYSLLAYTEIANEK
jgi:hypothetical protein